MYNRYVPQSDGSFRRSHVAEQPARPKPTPRQEPAFPTPEPAPVTQENPPAAQEPPVRHMPKPAQMPRQYRNDASSGSISSFLKGLLPSNFDTEDLLVVLLLLLMSGNNNNDQNAALLTLGIYLFM